jgi:biotin carboxyl carrier protein
MNWDILPVNDAFHMILNGKGYRLEWVSFDAEHKITSVKVNGTLYPVQIQSSLDLLLKKMGMNQSGSKKMAQLKAPMPGLVLKTLVHEGDSVEKDTPLIILEAMKMENVIKASASAVVKSIKISEGQAVEKSQLLIEFA